MSTKRTKRTYYWEHRSDESRYLRNTNARKIAEVAHAQPDSEIGVIVDDGGPLKIKVVQRGQTIRETAAALVNA